MHRTHRLLPLLATCALATGHAAPVFVNGSFETPTVTYQAPAGGNSTAIAGWTTVLSGVEQYNSTAFGLGAAADGLMVVDLAYYTSLAGGGIEQAVATEAGESYELSFYVGNTRSSGRTGTGVVRLTIDGTTTDFATPNASGALTVWEQKTFRFVARGSSTTVRFWNDQNPFQYFALIDGVGFSTPQGSVPEPATWALVGLGLLGLGRVRPAARARSSAA